MLKYPFPVYVGLLILLALTFSRPQKASSQASITSTPNSDGSIIHLVSGGESLISIAQLYQISVAEIKLLNPLSSDEIFPGDKIVIRAAATQTATDTLQQTSTSRPTHTPTLTPRPDSIAGLHVTPGITPTEIENDPPDRLGNILLGAIITLGIIGAAMMAVGYKMRRNSKLNGS